MPTQHSRKYGKMKKPGSGSRSKTRLAFSNASYKRARLVDIGNNNWEVVREVGNEDAAGKRRDSGLPIDTNSKWDVVGVVVKKIIVEGDHVKLGDELGAQYWKQ